MANVPPPLRISPPPEPSSSNPPGKRKIHTDDEPLPAQPNPVKRVKKTVKPVVPKGFVIVRDNPSTTNGLSHSSSQGAGPSSSFSQPKGTIRQFSRDRTPPPPIPKYTPLKRTRPISGNPPNATRPPSAPPSTASKHEPFSSASRLPSDNTGRRDNPTNELPPNRPPSTTSVSKPYSLNGHAHRPLQQSMTEPDDVFSAGSSSGRDITMLIPSRDTPRIERNQSMRSGASQRRRSSLGDRGKRSRAGSIGKSGGLITPHPQVSPSNYHRHIAPDLPDSERLNQLLVWGSSRAQTSSPSTKSSLPPLSDNLSLLLKRMQDETIRRVAEGLVDTSSKGKGRTLNERPLKPNPMNEANRQRAETWKRHHARARAEDADWAEVSQAFSTRYAEVVARLEAEAQAKANGEAAEHSSEWVLHLDERWRASAKMAEEQIAGLQTAQQDDEALRDRLQGVEYDVDELHSSVYSISEMTRRAEQKLSKFSAGLAASLKVRTLSSTCSHPTSYSISLVTALSSKTTSASQSHPHPSSSSGPTSDLPVTCIASDPLAVLRAFTVAEAPKGAAPSGAALRAAKDVRSERKMTAVPPTPSKTARRGSTPGRKQR